MDPLDCGHMFHKSCISQYIKMKINDKQEANKIGCPACRSIISTNDVKYFCNSDEFNKLLKFQLDSYLEQNNQFVHCPTPGCENVIEHNGNSIFTCEACKISYCVSCKYKWHEGISCPINLVYIL